MHSDSDVNGFDALVKKYMMTGPIYLKIYSWHIKGCVQKYTQKKESNEENDGLNGKQKKNVFIKYVEVFLQWVTMSMTNCQIYIKEAFQQFNIGKLLLKFGVI